VFAQPALPDGTGVVPTSDALLQVVEVVGEGEVNHPVRPGGGDAEALEVCQLAPLNLGARGGESLGTGARMGE
jgi:hypothetical protein